MSDPIEWPIRSAFPPPRRLTSASVQAANASIERSGGPSERPCPGRSSASDVWPWWANQRACSAQTRGPCRRRAGRPRAERRIGGRGRRWRRTLGRPSRSTCMASPSLGCERLAPVRGRRRCRLRLRARPTGGSCLRRRRRRRAASGPAAMRGAGGMDDQRLGVADIGEVAREPQASMNLRSPPRARRLMPKVTIEPAPRGSRRLASS